MKSIANPADARMFVIVAKAEFLAERLGVAVAAKYLAARNVSVTEALRILAPVLKATRNVKSCGA